MFSLSKKLASKTQSPVSTSNKPKYAHLWARSTELSPFVLAQTFEVCSKNANQCKMLTRLKCLGIFFQIKPGHYNT